MSCKKVANNSVVCDAGTDSKEAFRLAAEEETDKAYSPGQAIRIAAAAVSGGYSTVESVWQDKIDGVEEWANSKWPWYFYPLKPHAYFATFMLNGQKTVITKGVDAVNGLASLPHMFIDDIEKAARNDAPNPTTTGALMLLKDLGMGMVMQAEHVAVNLFETPFELAHGNIGEASRMWNGAVFDIAMLYAGVKGVGAGAVGVAGKANGVAKWLAQFIDNSGAGGALLATNTGRVLTAGTVATVAVSAGPQIGSSAGMLAMGSSDGAKSGEGPRPTLPKNVGDEITVTITDHGSLEALFSGKFRILQLEHVMDALRGEVTIRLAKGDSLFATEYFEMIKDGKPVAEVSFNGLGDRILTLSSRKPAVVEIESSSDFSAAQAALAKHLRAWPVKVVIRMGKKSVVRKVAESFLNRKLESWWRETPENRYPVKIPEDVASRVAYIEARISINDVSDASGSPPEFTDLHLLDANGTFLGRIIDFESTEMAMNGARGYEFTTNL